MNTDSELPDLLHPNGEREKSPANAWAKWIAERRRNLRALWGTPTFQWPMRLWLGWIAVMLLFQVAAGGRLDVVGPDTSYGWTEEHSTATPRTGIGLSHVRWDSYHYLRIARVGYHEPEDAAYYPAYPVLMRAVTVGIVRPLMSGASALSQYATGGLLISIMASLVTAWAMFALAKELLGDDVDALRATFYLLTFPTALFMTQVYTESLYLALSTPALLCVVRRQWWAAGVLAALATVTRATGVLLTGAMAVYWWQDWRSGARPRWPTLLAMVLPAIGWRGHNVLLALSGLDLDAAYALYGRKMFNVGALDDLAAQLGQLLTDPMGAVMISLDMALPLFGLWAIWQIRREWPGLALYGAAAIGVPMVTGTLVSLNRYTLVAVPVYLGLAIKGRNPLFDRLWTMVSVLLLALYLIGFTHGYWTG